jgi:hypothetical protein
LLSGSESRKAKLIPQKKKQSKKLNFEVVIALFGRAGRLSYCALSPSWRPKKKYIAIFEKIISFSAIKFSNFGRHLPGSGFTIKTASGFKKLWHQAFTESGGRGGGLEEGGKGGRGRGGKGG